VRKILIANGLEVKIFHLKHLGRVLVVNELRFSF